MLTSVASLIAVMGTLGALLWWARRVGARTAATGRYIEVVETVGLGPGRSLHLIRLGSRAVLVASSSSRCELLCELEEMPAERSRARGA